MLGIYAGLMLLLVTTETIGKLGSYGSDDKIKSALSSRRVGDPEEGGRRHIEDQIHLDEAALHKEHEHGLTPHELGEDDAGEQASVGMIRVTKLGKRQRLAYAF